MADSKSCAVASSEDLHQEITDTHVNKCSNYAKVNLELDNALSE
jgi:hypothetical protein